MAQISIYFGCMFLGLDILAWWQIKSHVPNPLFRKMLSRLLGLGLFILLVPTLAFSLLSFFLPTRFFLLIVIIASILIVGLLSFVIFLKNYRDFARAHYPPLPLILRAVNILPASLGLLLISGGVSLSITNIFSFSEVTGLLVTFFCLLLIGSGAFVGLSLFNKHIQKGG